ncbi:MAG: MBL fold metallo-hydrolase [Lachnospiraceae bacterium]|nr:MBL fold metallo-hydrolase [Lachnospiraceae bacterium]
MKYTITQIKGGTDNCYIVSNGHDAILFDTASGNYLQQVKDECSKYNMKLIVLSHTHFDHAENAEALSKFFNIPVAYNEQDDDIFDDYRSQPLKSYGIVGFVVLRMSLKVLTETKVTRPENRFFVKEGDTLEDYGFPDIKIVELPGHSRGSVGLLVSDDALLVGDALDNWVKPGMGHLYTDIGSLRQTAEKIRSYGKRTYYYGHGKPTEKF